MHSLPFPFPDRACCNHHLAFPPSPSQAFLRRRKETAAALAKLPIRRCPDESSLCSSLRSSGQGRTAIRLARSTCVSRDARSEGARARALCGGGKTWQLTAPPAPGSSDRAGPLPFRPAQSLRTPCFTKMATLSLSLSCRRLTRAVPVETSQGRRWDRRTAQDSTLSRSRASRQAVACDHARSLISVISLPWNGLEVRRSRARRFFSSYEGGARSGGQRGDPAI